MAVEAERFSSACFTPPWVRHEHQARYLFAATFVNGRDVIDCACGTGEGSALFARKGARHVAAFDVSETALVRARQICAGLANVTLKQSDACALPLPDASADVFVSLETIEHLQDQTAFLREVNRLVRPGGIFICSTPNRRVYNPGRTFADRPWNRFHVREYDTREFRAALAAFFDDIEMYGQNPTPPWRVALSECLAALPANAAVRFNQVLKLPRFVFVNPSRHAVKPCADGAIFEYDVAVCRKRRAF